MPLRPLLAALCLVVSHPSAAAEVTAIEIESRELVAGGRPFGDVGPYEKLVGKIHFALDPENPFNGAIVDLRLAPRDESGRVRATGDLFVLAPLDREKGSGTALLEVSNRGGKASLGYFNRARFSRNPTDEAHFGDGFLMRRGLTVIWVGWQFDVPAEPDRLRLRVPVATGPDGPIEGLVRSDWTVDTPAPSLPLAHRNHVAYPVLDPEHPDNVLTVRDGRLAPRRVIGRPRWRFARVLADGTSEDSATDIALDGGFEAGRIYELVYRAKDPAVVGLGLAAVRDTISYAKYSDDCPFPVELGVAVGISQTGRFLRHFLYQGFNADEKSRRAFDGMLIHTAGAGRGSFNHRFAQPSRDAHRYSAFFYPTDVFPFSGRTQRDPLTKKREGLLARSRRRGTEPKIFYTNTGYEYWGRAASLLHTSCDGSADVALLENERIYHLASGQHFVVGFPPRDSEKLPEATAWRGNSLDFLVTERALLSALVDWVRSDAAPPPSAFPTIAGGELVSIGEVRFPKISGVEQPKVVHEAYRADYGPDWPTGRVTRQPPAIGPAFATLVAQVDEFGNEVGGVPTVETLAPIATYAPWHVRQGLAGGNGELTDFYGTYIPLPRTAEERERTGDARPSIEETYGSRDEYMQRAAKMASHLVRQGLLLPEDEERVVERAEAQWDWIHGR